MAARVEGEEDAEMTAPWTQLLHVGVAGSLDRVHEWAAERRAILNESSHRLVNGVLFRPGERLKPRREGVGTLHIPRHFRSIRANV
jgi:hypothetical protein